MGDQQQTQLARTYDVAKAHLAEMERRREELDAAIAELQEQIRWGEQMLTTARQSGKAAE